MPLKRLVIQQEALEGSDEIVPFIYFGALASIPTGAQLQNFAKLLCKSLRSLGGLKKKHLSDVFSLLTQMTLCSVLL